MDDIKDQIRKIKMYRIKQKFVFLDAEDDFIRNQPQRELNILLDGGWRVEEIVPQNVGSGKKGGFLILLQK